MRFQFLKPRKDVASAEQVRALRQARAWTVEQLADEVHAPALEVSAWEAGTVRVPTGQALLIHWMADVDAWRAALDAARGQSCAWVGEHAPNLYERMFRGRAIEDAREHVSGCAVCKAALERARQIGGYPARPDTSGSLLARYWHWVGRLPRWAQGPFELAGGAVEMTLAITFYALAAPEAWVGFMLGFAAFAVTSNALVRVTHRRLVSFLPTLTGLAVGLLGWSLLPGNDLSDPVPLLFVAGLVVMLGVGEIGDARAKKRKVRALAARATPVPALPTPSRELAASLQRDDPVAIRNVVEAGRYEH